MLGAEDTPVGGKTVLCRVHSLVGKPDIKSKKNYDASHDGCQLVMKQEVKSVERRGITWTGRPAKVSLKPKHDKGNKPIMRRAVDRTPGKWDRCVEGPRWMRACWRGRRARRWLTGYWRDTWEMGRVWRL